MKKKTGKGFNGYLYILYYFQIIFIYEKCKAESSVVILFCLKYYLLFFITL